MIKEDRKQKEQQVINYLHERAQVERETVNVLKNRKTSTTMVRDTLFLEQFKDIAKEVFKDKVVPSKYSLTDHKEVKSRIVNVLLSDLHFGAALDGREVPLQYGPVEEARRIAAIALQVSDYKPQYRKESVLFVHLLGDIIQGQIHDLRDGEPLAQQAAIAIKLLTQTILYFSGCFPKVVVRCTPGNHGRNMARHKERSINQKWDSIETIIYYGVKTAMANVPNVTVEIPYTPFYTCRMFDKAGFFSHGDTVLRPGNPGKAIDVASIQNQVNAWSEGSPEKYSLYAVGHVHVGSVVHLPNDVTFLSNGPLIPADAYTVSIGIPSTRCGQWLFESVKGYVVGDQRFLSVNSDTDKDKSLDTIIKPFIAF